MMSETESMLPENTYMVFETPLIGKGCTNDSI